MNDEASLNTLRAQFYLCLAHAFLTPLQSGSLAALRDDLPVDLAELAKILGYDIADELDELQRRLRAIDDDAALLQQYSRLFLQPPVAVHINTGVYLDGSFNGPSVQALEAVYRAHGLERAASFRDLADHVAMQLEFAAWLFDHEDNDRGPEFGGQFITRFIARWVSPWCADLAQAERELKLCDAPYLPLAGIVRKAALHDAIPLSDADPASTRREKALALARHKQAEKGVTAEDLAEIQRRLEARGLAVDHLAIDPMLRDAARGWQRMTPPMPRGK